MAADEFNDIFSDLRGQIEDKIILEDINKKILSTFELDVVIDEIVEQTAKLLSCERVTVYVIERGKDGKGRELVSRSLVGDEVKEIRVPYDHNSLSGFVASTGSMINIKDVYNEDEILAISPTPKFDKTWDQKTGYRTRSMLCCPSKSNEYIVGVIQALNKRDEGVFEAKDEEMIQEVAACLGTALENNQGNTRIMRKDKGRVTVNELLVERGLIDEAKLNEAIKQSENQRVKLQDLLVKEYDVPEKEIVKLLAEINDVEFMEHDPEAMLDPGLFDNIPEVYAKRHLVCPLRMTMDENNRGVLHLVMANPKDFVAIEDVEIRTGAKVKTIYMATKSDILAMIKHTLHPDEAAAGEDGDEADIGDLMAEVAEELGAEDEVETVNVQEGATEEDGPIVRLANRVIEEAFRKGGTDIHVEPKEEYVLVRTRVDGSLEKMLTVPGHAKRAIVSRYKIMAECNITERRIPQDGRIRFKEHGGRYDIELRVNICPTVGGNEDVVMRILADSKPLPLQKLGLLPYTFEPLDTAVKQPYGMILCVGPTGSGKTTTLHSAVSAINTPERKILTAENPVEITQDGLRQVQIKPEVGLTFEAALRAFLRQDPDVIMVGEMRDYETCQIAVEAALTGHLLLSTLHTNNAPETVTRLVDIGIDPVTLSDALLVVLAQRLAKTLCKNCKVRIDEPPPELLQEADGMTYENGVIKYLGMEFPPEEQEFYTNSEKGCEKCQGRTFAGRCGLHELLFNNDEVQRMIATKAKVAEIRKAARDNGMKELIEDGWVKVIKGFTSVPQITAVCRE